MNNPAVSVVIPCYNGEPYLRETLVSAIKQTHAPIEVIVVDDGSTDDSAAIAESFGSPIRVIRQENQGESVARNRGIEEARGKWIAFLDADDLWLPHKLERQMEVARDELGFVTSSHYAIPSERISANKLDLTRDKAIPIREENFRCLTIMREGAPCLVQSVMVRAASPVRFPTWTQNGEDTLYLLELSLRHRFSVVAEPLTIYRICHGGQVGRVDMACRWHESMTEWIQRNPVGIADRELESCQCENDRRLLSAATRLRRMLDAQRFAAIVTYCERLPHFSFLQELEQLRRRPDIYFRSAHAYRQLRRIWRSASASARSFQKSLK